MGTGIVVLLKKRMKLAADSILSGIYRARLKTDDFTILCPNCIAGNIYHRLQREFLTPTINCFTSQDEFIKLIRDPQHYFSQELRFIDSPKPFPVAMLDDLVYNFNHDTDPQKCRQDWERRKSRIHWDNLYIILYEETPMTRDEILSQADSLQAASGFDRPRGACGSGICKTHEASLRPSE